MYHKGIFTNNVEWKRSRKNPNRAKNDPHTRTMKINMEENVLWWFTYRKKKSLFYLYSELFPQVWSFYNNVSVDMSSGLHHGPLHFNVTKILEWLEYRKSNIPIIYFLLFNFRFWSCLFVCFFCLTHSAIMVCFRSCQISVEFLIKIKL